VIDMQHDIDSMKRYYSDAGWEQRRSYYENGPSAEWQELYREVRGLLGKDPGSQQAQDATDRWLALSIRAYRGEAGVQTDSPGAWADREHFPPFMKQRIAEFQLEEVTDFIEQAAMSSRKKYFSESAWAKYVGLRNRDLEENSTAWQTRVDLFHDVEAALGTDPAGDTAQALVRRWRSLIEDESGGHGDIQAGLRAAWVDRRNWSATLRWQTEGLHVMSFEGFTRAADFLDRALAADPCPI
jgi:hypothetical protein